MCEKAKAGKCCGKNRNADGSIKAGGCCGGGGQREVVVAPPKPVETHQHTGQCACGKMPKMTSIC